MERNWIGGVLLAILAGSTLLVLCVLVAYFSNPGHKPLGIVVLPAVATAYCVLATLLAICPAYLVLRSTGLLSFPALVLAGGIWHLIVAQVIFRSVFGSTIFTGWALPAILMGLFACLSVLFWLGSWPSASRAPAAPPAPLARH